MYTIELYIDGKRVDLFKDESVKITDSIQNIRDIDKVFTSFTQTFNLPASKVNNQIFKHYYNSDIDNGFDARKKVTSVIELNHLPFRTGKIKLEGVDLKDRKPHTYKVTFFGDISKLKDQLGGDKLSDMDFTGYDQDYSSEAVLNALQGYNASSNSIIVPLITHTQRLFFDSGSSVFDSGNLHYTGQNTGQQNHIKGVKWNELKYAIRVNEIIKQIELQYDIEFSTDFFRNTSVTEMENMFLWLHRKSGKVENLSGASNVETLVDFNVIDSEDYFEIYNTTFCSYYQEYQLSTFKYQFFPAGAFATTPYGVRIEENGTTVYNSGITLTGDTLIEYGTDFVYQGGCYQVYVETTVDMEFSGIQVNGVAESEALSFEAYGQTYYVSYNTGYISATDVFRFNVSKQMPDITILDFLTGLFKLFNLTAYAKDGKIVVQTLDDFYSEGQGHLLGQKGIDITPYVDIDSNTVDVALPFREIFFQFADTKTFLANKFGEITGRPWGKLSYTAGEENLDGGTYQIKAPFGHLLYERLTDSFTDVVKSIQWGYNVNNDQSAYLGKPLLFYTQNELTGGISVVDEVDSDNVAVSYKQLIRAILPFNTVELDPAINNFQLNFFQEINEWTRNENGKIFTGDLFSRYYTNYITSVFNPQQRLVKVTAYLPLSFLLTYKLSDRLIIADQQYKINSISTNLKTGKSNLELVIDRFVQLNP